MWSLLFMIFWLSHTCSPPDTSLSPVEQQKTCVDRERKCFFTQFCVILLLNFLIVCSVAALTTSISAVSDAFPLDSRRDQPLICEGVANSQHVNIYQSRRSIQTTGDKELCMFTLLTQRKEIKEIKMKTSVLHKSKAFILWYPLQVWRYQSSSKCI